MPAVRRLNTISATMPTRKHDGHGNGGQQQLRRALAFREAPEQERHDARQVGQGCDAALPERPHIADPVLELADQADRLAVCRGGSAVAVLSSWVSSSART